MATLVYIECHDDNGKLAILKASWAAVNAAKLIGHSIHALLVGRGVSALAADVAAVEGVDKVLCLDEDYYQFPLPERVAPLLLSLVNEHDYAHVLATATGVSKNILPRLAAHLDVMQVSEVTSILDANRFEHFIYAGSVIETVEAQQDKQVLTIRSTHFDNECNAQVPAPIEILSLPDELKQDENLSRCIDVDNYTGDDGPELSMAQVVVAGGGGLASEEEFNTLIKPLAAQLNAAIGSSAVPIANGYCGSECLVGQTGKAIAPSLYIAVGISGATQHISGMKDARTIIAINSDEAAPIFKHADYGLVADAKQVLPEIYNQLQK